MRVWHTGMTQVLLSPFLISLVRIRYGKHRLQFWYLKGRNCCNCKSFCLGVCMSCSFFLSLKIVFIRFIYIDSCRRLRRKRDLSRINTPIFLYSNRVSGPAGNARKRSRSVAEWRLRFVDTRAYRGSGKLYLTHPLSSSKMLLK